MESRGSSSVPRSVEFDPRVRRSHRGGDGVGDSHGCSIVQVSLALIAALALGGGGTALLFFFLPNSSPSLPLGLEGGGGLKNEGGIPSPLSSKQVVFGQAGMGRAASLKEFPLTAEFRSGPRNLKRNYNDWVEQQMMPGGHAVDVQTNVLRLEPRNYEFANRFAKLHPETTVLSTWRAAGGLPKGANNPGDPLGSSTISFPGHWVQSPGTLLSQAVSASSTTVSVVSTQNMIKGPALLVEVDGKGNRLWDRFEYVLITSVGSASISVRREFNGSPAARAFPSRSTYVAPMPWDSRSRTKYVVWFFNISGYCPRDPQGRTAMDVIAEDMLDPLRPGGGLDRISGLDLASGPLTVIPDNADYDLDGRADPGSVYTDGVESVYRRIRSVLGPDRILTTSLDLRYLEYINGVNQEGLAEPDDPWDEITETVNEVLAWRKLSPLPMVSLAFQQHMSRDEDLIKIQLQRLLNGYSVCLGMSADIDTGEDKDIDALDALKNIELYKGDANEVHWLGRVIGMKRTALMTPNILGNARSPTDWSRIIPAISVKRGSLSVEGDEMVLTPQSKSFKGYVTIDLDFFLPSKSDFTVLMEIKSDDDQIERRILLPRVNVKTDTKPLRGKFTSKDFLPLTFFVRGASGGSVTIDFRFDDGGPVRFKALSVHAATDALACEFERGVVVVNPSLEDESFDLNALFPGRGGFRRITASEPSGASNISDKYRPQLRQAMQLNNGQRIADVRSVDVTERNSIFLIADPVFTSEAVEVDGFQLLSTGSTGVVTGIRPTPSLIPQSTPSPTKGPTLRSTSRPTARIPPPPTPTPNVRPTMTPPTGEAAPTPQDGYTLAQKCSGDMCNKCEGDCDTDDDCADGLVCFLRNRKTTRTVAGCDGIAQGGTDYCVDKWDFPAVLQPYISSNPNVVKNNIFDFHTITQPNPPSPSTYVFPVTATPRPPSPSTYVFPVTATPRPPSPSYILPGTPASAPTFGSSND